MLNDAVKKQNLEVCCAGGAGVDVDQVVSCVFYKRNKYSRLLLSLHTSIGPLFSEGKSLLCSQMFAMFDVCCFVQAGLKGQSCMH